MLHLYDWSSAGVTVSVESQKGIITIQQYSIENQKGAITVKIKKKVYDDSTFWFSMEHLMIIGSALWRERWKR